MSHSFSASEGLSGASRGRSVEEALAHWIVATSEMARSDDLLTAAFAIARRQRSRGCA